jgi:hypothetical protein
MSAVAASALEGEHPSKRTVAQRIRRARERGERYCVRCGCTDARACEGGCSWVTLDECSTCIERTESAPRPA